MASANDENDISVRLEDARKSAGFWANAFRVTNWFSGIAVVILGALVATTFLDDGKTFLQSDEILGVLAAFFGGVIKLIEPGLKAVKHTTRKRVIELIDAKVRNEQISENEARELLVRARIDPNPILEKLIQSPT